MEFSSRNFRPSERAAAPASGSGSPSGKNPKTKIGQKLDGILSPRGQRILFGVLLVSATIVAVSAIALLSTKTSETRYVNKDGYQVVALTDKQVYFGKVSALNDRYIALNDVFYLNQGSSSSTDNVSLIKRGGEVHCPQDRMIISRSQVNFWENIRSDGQIGKLISKWKSDNPDGQECSTAETTTGDSVNNSVTPNTPEPEATDESANQDDQETPAP